MRINSIFIVFAFVFINFQLNYGQNLVPNPSFEDYNFCPTQLGDVKQGVLKNWTANPSTCTPDYYQVCGSNGFSIPKNVCGNLNPKSGNAYIGLIMRAGESKFEKGHVHYFTDWLYREHIQTKLTTSLKKNYLYHVKMYVALSEYSNYTAEEIGIWLVDMPLEILEDEEYAPQILSKEPIIEAGKWMLIEDTLLAKGDERYLIIGNFSSHQNRKVFKINENPTFKNKFSYQRAYFFVDDVSVLEIGEAPIDLLKKKNEIVTDFGKLKEGDKIILKDIFFEYDKATLLPNSMPELNRLYHLLKTHKQAQIAIIGHTDSIGTVADNQLLSIQRAESVINYLVGKGIPRDRLSAHGFGESKPIDDNGTAEGRQNNRRVEFILRKTGKQIHK